MTRQRATYLNLRWLLCALLWCTVTLLPCQAQEVEELHEARNDVESEMVTDTIVVDSAGIAAFTENMVRMAPEPKKTEKFVPDPIRSMWLGMVFPGGGQIYNRKFWKLPIIYGGFLGCAYALTWNNQMLHDYSQAYLDIMDSDPNTKSYEKMLPIGYKIEGREDRFKEIFKNKKNYFRKYRDMSVFAFAGVYLLSVIDAYVDGELSTFDISEDLSLHVAPAVIKTTSTDPHHGENVLGVQCSLNF